MNLSLPFIKRPVMTVLLALTAIAFGISAYMRLPVSDLPDVDYPVIVVRASYPGADPQTMASNVASPLEKQFLQIQGLTQVVSESRQGNTSLTLQFELDKPLDAAATDVQTAINLASGQLPNDLPSPPTYEKTNPNREPIFYIALTSDSMTRSELYDFAFNNVAQRINTLPGVSNVDVYGAPRAVRILVDPGKLYARGLTATDVVDAVRASSVSLGTGELKGKETTMVVDVEGQLEYAQGYREIILAYRDGAPVYLRDVAEVIDSIQNQDFLLEPFARGYDIQYAAGVVLAVNRADGANTVAVANDMRKLLPQLEQSLPGAIKLVPMYDRSLSIIASVNDVKETLLIAFGLVVLVIFLFLGRVRDTVIPAVALPMAMLLTFSVMKLLGFSLDNLSLMALTLSIGFLVDDAIVFLENMVRRMEEGEGVMEAAINGAQEISFTIVSMTLALAAVFLPLVFMPGIVGRIFEEFALTIIIATISSGLVSLTLTPMMCSRSLKGHNDEQETPLQKFSNAIERRILTFYDVTLTWALRHWYVSVILFFLCLGGTVWLYMAVPKGFLPKGDSGFIQLPFLVNEGTAPEKMQEYQKQIGKALQSNQSVDRYVTVTGVGQFLPSNLGIGFVFLEDQSKRPPIDAVVGQLQGALFSIPGIMPLPQAVPSLDISTGATENRLGDYAYTIYGIEPELVYQSANSLFQALQGYEGFAPNSLQLDVNMNNPTLDISIDRDLASTFGVTAYEIENLLRNSFSEDYVYLIKETNQQYQVIVEAAPDFREMPANLRSMYLQSAQRGELVPLSGIVGMKETVSPLKVNHYNNFLSASLYFNLQPGFPIGTVTDYVEQKAAQTVDPAVQHGFQGQAQTFQSSIQQLGGLFIIAIFSMYIILGILYESYIHPLTVLSAIVPATVGGLFVLWITGSELTLYAYIGLFMLAGIVEKNGIILIDFAIAREREGRSPVDAVHDASMARFRPIIMTTVAAFMGAVPLAVGWGAADAESRMPLGWTIVGGIVFSQAVTLYITPVVYLGMDWIQRTILDRIPFFQRGDNLETDTSHESQS